MTDKVQRIREEVARLQNELIQEREKGYGSDVDDACILELQNVLTYIDTLQEEPVSEELEEAAFDYAEACKYEGGEKLLCVEHFKTGAKWQKQQTISKACKWIDKNAAKYLVDRFVGSTRVVGLDNSIIDDFKKDIED